MRRRCRLRGERSTGRSPGNSRHYLLCCLNQLLKKYRMKNKLLCIFSAAVLLQCCAPSTYITGTWKAPAAPQGTYSSILVAALTSNTIAKATLENDMAKAIGSGVTVLKSIDEFPPGISGADSN